MKLEYENNGNYQIPMLQMDEQPDEPLTKYGKMRKTYLKEHRRGMYTAMMIECTLYRHLLEIQKQAEERMEVLTEQMMKAENVTEQLKAENQMLWVQKRNNIQQRAEEIVRKELINS